MKSAKMYMKSNENDEKLAKKKFQKNFYSMRFYTGGCPFWA